MGLRVSHAFLLPPSSPSQHQHGVASSSAQAHSDPPPSHHPTTDAPTCPPARSPARSPPPPCAAPRLDRNTATPKHPLQPHPPFATALTIPSHLLSISVVWHPPQPQHTRIHRHPIIRPQTLPFVHPPDPQHAPRPLPPPRRARVVIRRRPRTPRPARTPRRAPQRRQRARRRAAASTGATAGARLTVGLTGGLTGLAEAGEGAPPAAASLQVQAVVGHLALQQLPE